MGLRLCHRPEATVSPERMFAVAWIFFTVAAGLGFLLRWQVIWPLPGIDYGNVLHAHSHVAFLGWVFNAFFALAVRLFVPSGHERKYAVLFVVTQAAVIGMLIAFPLQGYARESIVFSTAHMVCAAVFIIWLLRENEASPTIRLYLWAAGIFLLISSLGPLALGPLMVAGMRASPWYDFAVAYYLHFQYNGWFLLFLMAAVLQAMGRQGGRAFEAPARRASGWLVAGCVLTLAVSALPMRPPAWVFVAAALGAVAQCVGCYQFVRAVCGPERLFQGRGERLLAWLASLALAAFLLRTLLLALAAWPGLIGLVTNHFTIIVFMHLVFLGTVVPMLIAFAIYFGWIRNHAACWAGLTLLAAGALASQATLAYLPLAGWFGWPSFPHFPKTQLIAAGAMLAGVLLMVPGLRRAAKPPRP